MEIVYLIITAVAMVALTIWIGRKIRPKGSEYMEAGSDTEQARAHSAAYNNIGGGW